jgi:RimJ/RimL family protein N-acetyltransferase
MSLLSSDQSLETERLLLRRISREDFPFYARIHADPDVARYLAHGKPRSLQETTDWLAHVLDAYRELELGQIAITRKSDGALLGRCGVSHLEIDLQRQPNGAYLGYYYPNRAPKGRQHAAQHELGYTLDRTAWGNGYAREAVRAMWSYLSSRRPNLRIVSLIHPDNLRSIRLASSFGAARVDSVDYVGRIYDRYVWPIHRAPGEIQ